MPSFKLPAPPPEEIERPVLQDLMIKEVEALRDGKTDRLLQSKNYEVFFASADKIPNVLKEIGRLREITFRAVGEGTNKSIELDQYDTY